MIKRATLLFFLCACIGLMLLPAHAQSEVPSTEPGVVQSDSATIEPAPAQSEVPSTEPEVVQSSAPATEAEVAQPEASSTESEVVLPEITEDEGQFDVELEGRKTWTIRYGLGNPVGLAASGLSPGQLSLDQTLTANIVGEALSVLTIEANYNDQMPETMQSLVLHLDTDRLDGVAGDFVFQGLSNFTAYSKKMTGLQLEYLLGNIEDGSDDVVLTAVVSKSEGVSETVTFRGQTAHAQIEYSERLDSSNTVAPYHLNLSGLYSYPLEVLYAEEFSSIHFQFEASPSLRSVLSLYEVAFLFDALALEPELEMKLQEFQILDADEQVLLLQRDPVFLIRERLRDLIDVYNEQFELTGSEAKKYPFTVRTDYELGFLSAVAPFGQIVVDDIVYPLDEAERRRFYELGYTKVQESSAQVEVSTDGRLFDVVTDFRFPDFRVTIHEEAGILECDFPASFYTPSSVLRVGFDYSVSKGSFLLDGSVIPGSERVTLNSIPLERDKDYRLEYEVGMLFLFVDMDDADVLKVDYELYAGGFGVAVDYASYFYGLTLDYPVSENLTIRGNLLQLADVAGSSADATRVDTMPNRHTVAGVQAGLKLSDFTADIAIGYNQDRFPFDDNERLHGTNAIHAIASGEGYVLLGHHGGVTVNDSGRWQTYGSQAGLSNDVVQAIAFGDGIAFIGTGAGLTIVRLDGASPFDRAVNWTRYFINNELSDSSITAVLVYGETVWIGTRDGLVIMLADGTSWFEDWTQREDGGFDTLPPVTAFEAGDGILYIGTENGVYAYDISNERLEPITATDGLFVNDLALANETLYVASNRGLRSVRDGRGSGWLVPGQPVYTVAYANNTLYYGLDSGLMALGSEVAVKLPDWEVTALGSDVNGVWVGVRASASYEMNVWLLAGDEQIFVESVTGITGQDPRVFMDSVVSDHTATGWTGRASFNCNTDDYAIRGSVDLSPPTFRSIGSLSRSDSTGWGLHGTFSLGERINEFSLENCGTLTVDHNYRMTGHSSKTPRDVMTNNVSLDGSFASGLGWNASIRHVETNETDTRGENSTREITTSVSAHDTFFRDALDLRLSWNRTGFSADRWDEQWQSETVGLRFDWRLSSVLSTDGLWTRPVRWAEQNLSGAENVTWHWDWTPSLTFADLDVNHTATWEHTLFEDSSDWTHAGKATLNLNSFNLEGWDMSPDVILEGDYGDSATDLHAKFIVKIQTKSWTVGTTLRGDLTQLGRPVFKRKVQLLLSVKYTGLEDLDLAFDYTGSRDAAVKVDEIAPSFSDSITGRLTWKPEDGPRDELSCSVVISGTDSPQQVEITIINGLTMALSDTLATWLDWTDESLPEGYPIADLSVDSEVKYRTGASNPGFSFSTTGRVFTAMAQRWNVALAATYQVGHKTAIGLYHSFSLELTFAIEF